MPRLQARNFCMVVYSQYNYDSRPRRQAAALWAAGYQVDVICLREPGHDMNEVQNGIHVYHVPLERYRGNGALLYFRGYGLFLCLALARLLTLFVRRRYAVIQIDTPPDFLIFAALPFKLFGTRLILDIHDTMPELYASRFGETRRSLMRSILVLQERVSTRVADRVLAVTQREQEILSNRGVPPGKIVVVMNSADERIFNPALYESDSRIGNDPRFVALYHGTVVKRLGLETFVRAAAKAAPSLPGLQVNIVGPGDFLERVESLIHELGVRDVVHLVGAIPYDEIASRIAGSDVCVVPIEKDSFTETILPVKLLEAVAMERPVIASRTSTIADHFDDRALCFFTPGDSDDLARSLIRLAADASLRRSLVAEASRQAQPYHWTQNKARYLSLVAELAAEATAQHGKSTPERTEALR